MFWKHNISSAIMVVDDLKCEMLCKGYESKLQLGNRCAGPLSDNFGQQLCQRRWCGSGELAFLSAWQMGSEHVTTVKIIPSIYRWHFNFAHSIAGASNSQTAHLVSASLRNLDPDWIGKGLNSELSGSSRSLIRMNEKHQWRGKTPDEGQNFF